LDFSARIRTGSPRINLVVQYADGRRGGRYIVTLGYLQQGTKKEVNAAKSTDDKIDVR
jgi:hypothetical protein